MPSDSVPIRQLPVSRNSLLDFPRDPIAEMRRLHEEFGDIAVVEDQGQRIVFVFSPEYNRQVLTDCSTFHSRFFAVRGSRKSAQRRVTSGLLSMNGTEHRDNRRMMMEVFSKKILPSYHDTISQLTDELMTDWSVGQVRDLNSEIVHYLVRLTGALLFGISDGDYAAELGLLIDQWVRRNHEVGIGALVPDRAVAWAYEELLQQAEVLEAGVREMFLRHRETHGVGEQSDVLSLLFRARASGEQLSDEALVGHATLTFAAAHLTTAHTLTWTLFLLAQHPRVMQRLAEELEEHTTGDFPTFEEVQSLTYLEQVLKESMRVLPASSYSQRVVAQPTQLGPLSLSAGTPVIFSQYITHHRADLFEAPDEFRPERWESINPSAYEYLPFGAGPRKCIGAPLAMVELQTALAVILKRFHMQIAENSTVNAQVISTMLGPTSSVDTMLLDKSEVGTGTPVHGTIHNLVRLPHASRATMLRRAA
ncbi:MAG: cytochrome P450 [Planctomycetaceae bacterium]|nr:cytochrome P450 [Planctomycetaceae bacterium]